MQREDLVSILEGRDPRTGTRLGRGFSDRILADGRVVRPVIGFDATFSAPKTVSVMWALTQDAGWLAAHDIAVHAVLEHLQAHAATTRVRTSRGRDYPDTGGLITAVFRQHTSRADDPQIHTHAFVSSKVQTADGGWWALDARYLKRYQRALGGLYQTVLRAELTARYGVEWTPVVNGQAELAAVPAELVEQFSKRSSQVDATLDAKVEAFTDRNGRPPTSYERAALVREAALDSRTAKSGLTHRDLTDDWIDQARALGWDTSRLAARVVPDEQVRDARRVAQGLGTLGATRAWVDHLTDGGGVLDQVTSRLATAASTWHRGDILRAVTDLVEPPAAVVGERWAALVEEVVDRYATERCITLDPQGGGRERRGSDGRAVHLDPMLGPYTTTAILAQEEQLVTWTLDHTPDTPAPSTTTARVLETGTRLDRPQLAAARAVAGSDDLVVVIGPAGTGKTSTLAAAVTDLETQGRAVFGVAPSNQAAHILATETAMATDSVAKLLYEHGRPDRGPGDTWQLPAGATLIVDEAGMLATNDLAALTTLADQHRWRLVLVGDPYQLPAVGRGGMFAELARLTTPVELTVVRRFTNDWEGPASLALRHGDPGVIGTYHHHQRIRAGTFDDHTARITQAWFEHATAGRSVAITAATNDEVDRLNTAIQTARLDHGDLNPALAVDGAGGDRLHPCDVVATRRNDRTLTTSRGVIVRNRATWTVTNTDPDTGTITVHGRDGTVQLPAGYVAEHVRLAYAATTYGTQGATVDHSITLVSGATDHRNLYVGTTRGRASNELYVIADNIDDARDVLEAALERDRVDTPAITVRRELLGQDRQRGMTVGSASPTIIPPPSGRDVRTPEEPPVVVTAGFPSDRPHQATDPFAGMETVNQALHRLQAERADRQAPRDAYQALQNRLHALRYERELLDKPWNPDRHTPLDPWAIARHNAQADINTYTARLAHTGLGHRRPVRRLLTEAQESFATADGGWHAVYEQEAARLDPLIDQARRRLERTTRPEPVGEYDRNLDLQIQDLYLEVSLGNADRPSLNSLRTARRHLTADGRPHDGERAVVQTLDTELTARTSQRRDALANQLAQQQARSIGHEHGPELGL